MPKVYESILYASCWEDPTLDREAFHIDANASVFTITSGGCNALAFLIDNPKEVIALDINPHQNYLLELKMAAFRSLEYAETLAFFGIRASADRLATYQNRLRVSLSPYAQSFWDTNPHAIDAGIIHCGQYERYMRLLRTALTALIGKRAILHMFEPGTPAQREEYYHTHWMTFRWKFFLSLFLNRRLMTMLFDKAFFAQLESNFSFGKHFERRFHHALTELSAPALNPFLNYIMRGTFVEPFALPLYLREEHYETIRARLDRIVVVNESCEDYFARLPENRITHFNFTNIFEWMTADAFERVLRTTIRIAKPGATLTYRNLLVPRARPGSLACQVIPNDALAKRLAARDLSFIYSNYRVERVQKNKTAAKPVVATLRNLYDLRGANAVNRYQDADGYSIQTAHA